MIDKNRGSNGLLEKINDHHIIPEKIKKRFFSKIYAKFMQNSIVI